MAWARRHRATRPWSPERSTSGTCPAPEVGGPGVLRVLEQPVAEALLGRGGVVAHDPGHQSGHRLDHGEGGHLTAGQHEVADGQLAVDEVVGDPLVDALVAAAQQARTRRRPASSVGPGLVETPAAGSEQEQRPGRVDRLDAAKTGSGREHHAGARHRRGCRRRSGADRRSPERRSWTRRSSNPARPALPIRLASRPRGHQVGKNSEHVDAHGWRPAPAGHRSSRPDGRSAVNRPAWRWTMKCRGIRPPVGQDQEVARRVGLAPPRPCRSTCPPASTTVGADQLVHPQGVGVVERRRPGGPVPQGLGAVSGRRRPRKDTSHRACRPSPAGAWPGPLQRAGGTAQAAPGATRSARLVHKLHDDLAVQAVGPGDPADLQERHVAQSTMSTTTSTPSRAPGGPDHAADGLGHPAPTADHLAHVVGRHVERQLDRRAGSRSVSMTHGVGVVDELAWPGTASTRLGPAAVDLAVVVPARPRRRPRRGRPSSVVLTTRRAPGRRVNSSMAPDCCQQPGHGLGRLGAVAQPLDGLGVVDRRPAGLGPGLVGARGSR